MIWKEELIYDADKHIGSFCMKEPIYADTVNGAAMFISGRVTVPPVMQQDMSEVIRCKGMTFA